MALRTELCIDCKKPVIRAVEAGGKLVIAEPDPMAGGRYRLTERPGLPALAATATPKLAFGVALYVIHKCTGTRWRKKR